MEKVKYTYTDQANLPTRDELFEWLERKPGTVDTMRRWNTTAIELFQAGLITLHELGTFSIGFAHKTDIALHDLRELVVHPSRVGQREATIFEMETLGEACRTRFSLIAAFEQSQADPQQELETLLSSNPSSTAFPDEPSATLIIQEIQLAMLELGANSMGFAYKTDTALNDLRKIEVEPSEVEIRKSTIFQLQSLGETCRTHAFLTAAIEQSQTGTQQILEG